MKAFWIGLFCLVGVMFLTTGCEDGGSSGGTQVRFENRSANKTVYAVWDGGRTQTLAPGQKTDYMDANAGRHTLMWKNANNNGALTSMSWPSLVDGQSYTFPYY